MVNYHDHELTVHHLVGNGKESPFGEAEKPQREPDERTTTVWYSTVGARLTEAGIKVFEDLDSNEQRAATTAGEIMRVLAYQEILEEKK